MRDFAVEYEGFIKTSSTATHNETAISTLSKL